MKKTTLIFGSGKHAVQAANMLTSRSVDVFLCAKEKISDTLKLKKSDNLHVYEDTRVVSSKGRIGDFRVKLNTNGTPRTLHASTVLVAEEFNRRPAFEAYGLSDSFSVASLSSINEVLAETVTDVQQTAAFLTGLSYEGHPLILDEVMRAAMSLQMRQNSQVYVFTGNLKVAQKGLESMYRESRKKGVVYVKCDESIPEITQTKYGSVAIKFTDDISCEQFSLTPDIMIVDETISPDEYLGHLSNVFGLDTDTNGFLQTGNVHRTPVFTNVRGVLVAGPSRIIQSDSELTRDMEVAANEIHSLFEQKPDETIFTAEIFKGNCIRCLTCVRVCPYNAISLNTHPSVMQDVCEGCGICASNCPRHAITIERLSIENMTDRIDKRSKAKSSKTFSPNIIAFCCGRSAVQSYEHARLAGYTMPRGLKVIEVPCGGGISMEHLLYALTSVADGVMVFTCHDGNCHGEKGNTYARSRTRMVQDHLLKSGVEEERIIFTTIAANMGAAFAEESMAFNKTVKELGPSRLVNRGK